MHLLLFRKLKVKRMFVEEPSENFLFRIVITAIYFNMYFLSMLRETPQREMSEIASSPDGKGRKMFRLLPVMRFSLFNEYQSLSLLLSHHYPDNFG